MKTWRFIPLETHNAFMNMAIDEAILASRMRNLVPNTIRFYQWNPSAVSIGKNQKILEQIYPKSIKKYKVDVVRRTSGGGAVYHDQRGEITYSITALKKDIALDFTSVYTKIYSAIIDALRLLGIPADFVDGDIKKCPNLTVNGKKISGSAQTIKRDIIQQHGTILIGVNFEKMFKLLRIGSLDCSLATQIGKKKITSIQNELKHDIPVITVENALKQGFKAILKINLETNKLTDNEFILAKKLYENKYSKDDWNQSGVNSSLSAI